VNKYLIVFALFNIAIFILAGFILIAPVAGSLQSGRDSVRLQERRYSAERRLLAEYEDNLHELEEIRAERSVLEYSEMLPSLAEISMLSIAHRLNNSEFSASEISESMIGTVEISRLYEMRVRIECEGDFFDLLEFLREFSDGPGNARMFSIFDIMEENARLRLELSLHAIAGD